MVLVFDVDTNVVDEVLKDVVLDVERVDTDVEVVLVVKGDGVDVGL